MRVLDVDLGAKPVLPISENLPPGKLRRRGAGAWHRHTAVALVVAVALVASVLASLAAGGSATSAFASTPLTGRPRPAIPAGELGGPFTAASVRSAEEVLADSGVATVANETSKAPLVGVTGPVRLRFTRAQVQAMALQAADGGGILGATLGSVATTPRGLPPFSYVLASWVLNAGTPGSRAVHNLMGPQDWHKAQSVVFPAIALPLFVSDVVANTPKHKASSLNAAGENANSAAAMAEAMGFFDAPCSTVSNFVQDTIVAVFNALQLTPASGGGVSAGIANFFIKIWNGVLVLAQQVVQGLINKVSAYVVSKIRLAAGAAVIIANIVAYLNPWSVKVTGIPNPVAAGGIGLFSAKVDTGNGISAWPPALVDCLPAGVELPPLDAAHADATWSVAGAVSATSATSVTLSPLGQGHLDFATTAPATGSGCSSAGPAPPPQTGSATITVTRPGAKELKQVVTDMVSNGFGVAGSIVSPVLQAVLSPIFDKIFSALSYLTDVTGTGYVSVTNEAGAPARCTTTTAATTTTAPANKALVCPGGGRVASELGLSFSLDGTTFVDVPGLLVCNYVPPDDEIISCPQGDGSFINGAGGGCQLVQISESTGASAQGLNANGFCIDGCDSQGPLPGSAVGGDAAYEAIGEKLTDPKAILVEGVKDGFEVVVVVGWEADVGASEALIKALFEQYFGS